MAKPSFEIEKIRPITRAIYLEILFPEPKYCSRSANDLRLGGPHTLANCHMFHASVDSKSTYDQISPSSGLSLM